MQVKSLKKLTTPFCACFLPKIVAAHAIFKQIYYYNTLASAHIRIPKHCFKKFDKVRKIIYH